jgi:predicted transcriptional regulator
MQELIRFLTGLFRLDLLLPFFMGLNTAFSISLYTRFTSTRWCLCQMAKTRRSTVQVRFEILEYFFFNPKPQLRTVIWRKSTSLSYDDFLKHLSFLKERSLLEEDAKGYCKITNEGKQLYVELRKSLPLIL